ncbi:MAG: rod shape-determining protein MreD [Betaproteobacteria bacterium HGW-Betaproteobacteria-10]|jgi:rod shape-determining protein MreD|nr:MAG: rod shape-determining protein MreD [Betaproteobacteria bacterium HGW-Betaproteobacteria-10]
MQPTFSSSRILQPVRPWFIFLTLILAAGLNFLPTARWTAVPDWIALVLCFWCVREFRRVGMGWAFMLGLLMDVADGSVLGQHCFAYVLLAYVSAALSRRFLWFPLAQQALQVLPLLLATQLIQILMRMAVGADFPGWNLFIAPTVAAALWIPITYLLLLPQYRPEKQDPNRPI